MHAQTAHHLQRHDQNRNPLEPCRPKPNHLTKQTVAAQLPMGPRAPAGPGEPRVAGPSLGHRWGTRRRTVDHRPGFHRLRDLWAVQGGRATPQLGRPARLSPPARHRQRNRRRADVSTARGPRQHRSGRRPLPARDGGAGALRRGQGSNSRCGPTAAFTPMPWWPSVARRRSATPSPSASTPACAISSTPYPRRTGRPSPCILTLAMEPSAADRHSLGHDRPSSSEGRRAPYKQSPNGCLGQSSPYRARTGRRSHRRYRWKRNRDT